MPIKQLEGRGRMKRIGIVRLGEMVKGRGGKEYPRQTDYFVLKDAPVLAQQFGERPTVLEIMFWTEDLEQTFPNYMQFYSRRGLRCMGDGEVVRWRRGEDGQPAIVRGVNLETGEPLECPGFDCPMAQEQETDDGKTIPAVCFPTGRLRFMSAKQLTHGFYRLTVRKTAIQNFLGQFATALDAIGHISGYPWQLKLEKQKVHTPTGQRMMLIPQLEIAPDVFTYLLRERARQLGRALPPSLDTRLRIDAGEALDDGELAVEAEFEEAPVVDEDTGEILEKPTSAGEVLSQVLDRAEAEAETDPWDDTRAQVAKLIDRVQDKAWASQPASATLRGAFVHSLTQAFGDNSHLAVCSALLAIDRGAKIESTSELSRAQIWAVGTWLGREKDPDTDEWQWTNPERLDLMRSILREFERHHGQMEMELEGEQEILI